MGSSAGRQSTCRVLCVNGKAHSPQSKGTQREALQGKEEINIQERLLLLLAQSQPLSECPPLLHV